ncbi:hypothetical protein HY477_02720 [Candidatus Uhrbacteria bacterium]|nr:hypothetical protein [Candidatus Uhrbacteria bacterium]
MARQIDKVRCGVGCGETLVLVREGKKFMLRCPPGDNPGGHTLVNFTPGDQLPANFGEQMRTARAVCEERRDSELAQARDGHGSMRAVHARRAEVWIAIAALYLDSERLYADFLASSREVQPESARAAAV